MNHLDQKTQKWIGKNCTEIEINYSESDSIPENAPESEYIASKLSLEIDRLYFYDICGGYEVGILQNGVLPKLQSGYHIFKSHRGQFGNCDEPDLNLIVRTSAVVSVARDTVPTSKYAPSDIHEIQNADKATLHFRVVAETKMIDLECVGIVIGTYQNRNLRLFKLKKPLKLIP